MPVTNISVDDGFKLNVKDEKKPFRLPHKHSSAPQLLQIMESNDDFEPEMEGVTYKRCICVSYWLRRR